MTPAAVAFEPEIVLTRPSSGRLNYLDNLRVFLTILVVVHHAGQPYGPTGGAWPFFHATRFALLQPFFHINASFFMGLFFLLSGYFVPPAYDRKGTVPFLKDRLRRLGIPVLLWALLVEPLASYSISGPATALGPFWLDSLIHFHWDHLWFLGHLLAYAIAYAAYRHFRSNSIASGTSRAFPGTGAILAYVAALALVSTIVRIWSPMDVWINLPVKTEFAHLPQYCSLFLFGVAAYRYRWLESIPRHTGRLWLAIGLTACAVRFAYTLAHANFLRGSIFADLTWNLWEAVLCAGMCVGLIYWFQQHVRSGSNAARAAARNAYGVYLVHILILVLLQMAFERTGFGPLTLTILTGAITLVLSYYCTSALRRLPHAESVL